MRSSDDMDSVLDSYVNEIELLNKLKGSPYIIELIDAEVERDEMYVAMVLEVGEVDLSKVLQRQVVIICIKRPFSRHHLSRFPLFSVAGAKKGQCTEE
jgi:serine/threonine protein kinase